MAYTSFFRDPDALEAIRTMVIPQVSVRRDIKVWDAGCATGEEPFTLAMVFAQALGPFAFRNLKILATDYEESNFAQFARHIQEGRYTRQDIQWIPDSCRNYLEPVDQEFRIVEEIRDRVTYLQHDLLTLRPPETGFCLIVCKNVLMHFDKVGQEKVLSMFSEALLPEGYLVLDGNQRLPDSSLGDWDKPEPRFPLYRKRDRG